jgi:hypothetical protein
MRAIERHADTIFPTHMRLADILILLVIVALSATLFRGLVSRAPFGYDEADYMYVASKGFVSSYLDQPSVDLTDFVRTGIKSGLNRDKWRGLSAYIRQTNDITLYRHFHGPLFFYCLSVWRSLFGPGESVVRWTSFLSLMLTAVVVYVGSFTLADKRKRLVAVLATGFLVLSPTNVEGARWALPHGLYSVFAMATLFLAAKLVQTGDLRYVYRAMFALSFAFLTIEYAPLLAVVLAVSVFLRRRELFGDLARKEVLRCTLRIVIIPVVVVGVLWPAGVYKLSLLKTYIFFSYIATIRNQAYGADPLGQVWWTRFTSSPVEYSLLLFFTGYSVYLFFREHQLLPLQPFFLYALLMFLTTIRNHSGAAIHVLTLVTALGVISAFAISLTLRQMSQIKMSISAAIVLLGLIFNNFWFYYRIEERRPADQRMIAVLDIARQSRAQGHPIIVPQNYLPTLHYYLQEADVSTYTEGTGATEVYQKIKTGELCDLVYEGDKFGEFRAMLERSWSVRLLTKIESTTSGRAVAFYQLAPLRSTAVSTRCESSADPRLH